MENDNKLLRIAMYIATLILEYIIFAFRIVPVIGLNAPIFLAYYFDLYNRSLFVKIRSVFKFDTTFIFIIITMLGLMLVFIEMPFVASLILVFNAMLFWDGDIELN